MASVQQLLYVFPPAPFPEAVEWPGEPLGRSNTITRTKSRTKLHDKTIDQTPGRRDHLVNLAIAEAIHPPPPGETFLADAVIHGIRVRAVTNSPHLIEFWRENWYGPDEWRATTGTEPPADPQVVVYALGQVGGEDEAAYYSRATNTIVFFNTSYYGQLKSWVLGAVGRVLAAEFGIHSIHGACVERNGEGVLYIAPTGTGKSTSSYGLMSHPGTRFHSDDWVYVRYARFTKQDELVVPIEIAAEGGEVVRGFRCNPWIAANPQARGVARCLDLDSREVSVEVEAFDLRRPIQAYAYTSEKVFYLRSNLVESFPVTAAAILRANLENVPAPTAEFVAANRATLDHIVGELQRCDDTAIRQSLGAMPSEVVAGLVGSLIAFDNARAMLDIADVFPPSRVFTNPMEPVRLSTVFLLKRDPSDPVVLDVLSRDRFMERLLIGQTPDGKREVAYNAYRAVDDAAERQAINTLERESQEHEIPLYQAFLRSSRLPDSLIEEFSLFREMYGAALCYDLNTILQNDPSVTSKSEAVQRTLKLILRGIENRSPQLRLTLGDYWQQVAG
jgi:hypothetical protein